MSLRKLVFTILLGAHLSACASLPPPAPTTFLDEDTGVTLTVVAKPLVLARDRRDIAANARDYITLVAVERNQAGRRNLVLLAYRWSTIDRRVNPQADADSRGLVLVADGRDIRLQAVSDLLPTELRPRAQLLQPDVTDVAAVAYRMDEPTLRYLADSQRISGFYADARGALPFALWADGRKALGEFAASLGARPRR